LRTHTIKIRASAQPGRYVVTGAINVADSAAPVLDAARALKAAGAGDDDLVIATGGDCTFSPQTIGRLSDIASSASRSSA
jgi:hypothetical protein